MVTTHEDFKLITFKNNWFVHEYYVDGNRVQQLPGTIYVKNLIEPGKFEPVKIVGRNAAVLYSLPHTTSPHYFVKSELFGNEITIPLVSMINNANFFVKAESPKL